MRGVSVSRILPPVGEDKTTQVNIRMSDKTLARIQLISTETKHSKTAIILHFVEWALGEYEREQREKEAKAREAKEKEERQVEGKRGARK